MRRSVLAGVRERERDSSSSHSPNGCQDEHICIRSEATYAASKTCTSKGGRPEFECPIYNKQGAVWCGDGVVCGVVNETVIMALWDCHHRACTKKKTSPTTADI